MGSRKWKFLYARRRIATILLLRFVVGAVFVFSGFVKGVDVWGVEYKIGDYVAAFGLEWASPYVGFASTVLPLYEFVAGVLLIIGSFRRLTVVLLLAMMAFMLPLSLYIYVANPVADCGCFGDAVVISNAATFWKNVLIVAGLCVLLKYNKKVRSLYGPAVQWLTVVLPSVYLILIMLVGYFWQPVLDFRPFKVGTYIEGVGGSDDESSDFLFTYVKDGKEEDFSLDGLPDSTWTFVARKEVASDSLPVSNRVVNRISFYDGDTDVTDAVLPKEGDVALMLIPDIADINVASTFRINDMYELASTSGISMICLTGGSDADIAEWREISMADYPIYKMDDTELKTIARGNPALVRMRDGMILWKSVMRAVSDDMLVDDESDVQSEYSDSNMQLLVSATVVLLVAMWLLLMVNRSPLLIKFTKRLRKNQNKEVNLQKN